MKKILVSLTTLILISCLFIGCNRKESKKNYIIENSDKIVPRGDIFTDDTFIYDIDSLKGYYTDITIRLNSDSSYSVVYWGDRDSWLWDFKLDYYYSVDIPYNRSKGIDVSKDIELINILKNIK